VNFSRLGLSSDIKIDGIIGISDAMEKKHVVLLDFANNILAIADSSTRYDSKAIRHSVKMLYSDDGCESIRSRFTEMLPASKFRGHYKWGNVIETNVFFDIGCHWETVFLSIFAIDAVFNPKHLPGKKVPPRYHDPQEKVDYWIADSIIIAGKIAVKKVKSVYIKTRHNLMFGDLPVGVLLGAPFFKRFKQVYFNFPARRVDFVN
jgi:hypothetical protein